MEQFSSARHHLGFYNNVGISVHYKMLTTSRLMNFHTGIFLAVAEVIQKHPILSAIPVDEDTASPYFARLPVIDLSRVISFVTRSQLVVSGGKDNDLDSLLQDQHNTNFKADYGVLPFWRLIVLQDPSEQREFTACFIFHHSLGDGASGLVFHKSLLAAMNMVENVIDSETLQTVVESLDMPLLPSLESLHPLPIPATSDRSFTTTSVKEWTGDVIRLPCETRFKSLSISADNSTAFIQSCKQNGTTVTSALPALFASILFHILPPTIEALSCVIPVSLRRWLPSDITNDTMGVWIDAFQVPFFHSTNNQLFGMDWQQAQLCQSAIKAYLAHGGNAINVARFKNIPDISSIFTSKIGQPRDSAYEVSNLGVFNASGVESGWQSSRIVFSRSAFASGSAIAVSAVSGVDGAMSLGFTWQVGVVEEEVVERFIDGIASAFMGEGFGSKAGRA